MEWARYFDPFRSLSLIIDLFALFSPFLYYFARCMTKYRVVITEVLSRTIETEAESEAEAVDMVRQMYQNCDIVLDASDYIETKISAKR